MRSIVEREEVLRLVRSGSTDAEVAGTTGVPLSTVGRWRRHSDIPANGATRESLPLDVHSLPSAPYAYLLGIYLGDGCVFAGKRVQYLRISLDSRYPDVISECVDAMTTVMPDHPARVYPRPGAQMVYIQSHSRHWLEAFPQHGPGRKHERAIVLEPWQRDVLDRHPREFLRGLIHSDGCRTTNRFKTKLPSGRVAEYEYARYFFSNLSADIRGLFCEYCERLGIRWTQSNPRNISVSHRTSVAALDEFVGPKC